MQAPKVKLGDKITALQQIVSPFGKVTTHIALTPSLFSFPLLYKYMLLTVLYFSHYLLHYDQFFFVEFQTDTASVLFEAIGYIKFLQEQVQVGIIMEKFLLLLIIFNANETRLLE